MKKNESTYNLSPQTQLLYWLLGNHKHNGSSRMIKYSNKLREFRDLSPHLSFV